MLEAMGSRSQALTIFAVRGAASLVSATILLLTYWRRLQRRSFELGLVLVFVVGAHLVILHRLQGGRFAIGYTGTMLLVFLVCTTQLHVSGRAVAAGLSLIVLLHAIVMGTLTPWLVMAQELTTFVSGLVLAALGAQYIWGLQRAEFYARHRLVQANARLAKLEAPRPR
jgi:hypothetical protein